MNIKSRHCPGSLHNEFWMNLKINRLDNLAAAVLPRHQLPPKIISSQARGARAEARRARVITIPGSAAAGSRPGSAGRPGLSGGERGASSCSVCSREAVTSPRACRGCLRAAVFGRWGRWLCIWMAPDRRGARYLLGRTPWVHLGTEGTQWGTQHGCATPSQPHPSPITTGEGCRAPAPAPSPLLDWFLPCLC